MANTLTDTSSNTLTSTNQGSPLEKLQHRLNVKKLELNSLLEVTQAINNNLAEDAIYRIYHFTLRANMNISKLALYVRDEVWECKVSFGTETNFSQITLDPEILTYRDITSLEARDQAKTFEQTSGDNPISDLFSEFDLVIPIAHKKSVLAYVFVSKEKSEDDKQGLDTVFIQTLSNIVIVAIENKKLARQQLRQEAMNREMQIAQQVQTHLFPRELPNTRALKVKAEYFPHRSVSGDYYDFIRISPDEFLVCIADVSGKGMPAAILMSNFQASLRTMARQTNQLKHIIKELNHQIYQNARGENFITFFIALYNQTEQKLCYINAGHNPPIFSVPGEQIRLLDRGTTILGTFLPLPFIEETMMEGVIDFTLFCYTDGVTEVNNSEGEEYGPEKLIYFYEANRQLEPEIFHQKLIEELNKYKSEKEYDDDVTLLTCRVNNSK
jgi:sigma-B regulation protein RsbU (phosphoserine phosphatase)